MKYYFFNKKKKKRNWCRGKSKEAECRAGLCWRIYFLPVCGKAKKGVRLISEMSLWERVNLKQRYRHYFTGNQCHCWHPCFSSIEFSLVLRISSGWNVSGAVQQCHPLCPCWRHHTLRFSSSFFTCENMPGHRGKRCSCGGPADECESLTSCQTLPYLSLSRLVLLQHNILCTPSFPINYKWWFFPYVL